MITLKNRTYAPLVYQYRRDVSAGCVRPQRITVHRGQHNARTGERSIREQHVTVGGVLTIPPRGEKTVPDVLLEHEGLARDIAARNVIVKRTPNPTTAPSVVPAEHKAAPIEHRAPKQRKE